MSALPPPMHRCATCGAEWAVVHTCPHAPRSTTGLTPPPKLNLQPRYERCAVCTGPLHFDYVLRRVGHQLVGWHIACHPKPDELGTTPLAFSGQCGRSTAQ